MTMTVDGSASSRRGHNYFCLHESRISHVIQPFHAYLLRKTTNYKCNEITIHNDPIINHTSAKINQDFDSHILQTEWNNYRASHLQRHNQRQSISLQHEAEMQQKMESFHNQASQVHNNLDEMIDAAKSKLVDLEVEMEYDVNRLMNKYQGSISDNTSDKQCLDVRAELAQCYNTLKDGGECHVFAQRLEKCVTQALMRSS